MHKNASTYDNRVWSLHDELGKKITKLKQKAHDDAEVYIDVPAGHRLAWVRDTIKLLHWDYDDKEWMDGVMVAQDFVLFNSRHDQFRRR